MRVYEAKLVIRIERRWIYVEAWIQRSQLRGIVACRLFGHLAPDVLGDCERCRADLLHLSTMDRLRIAQRELNRHMAEHVRLLQDHPEGRSGRREENPE